MPPAHALQFLDEIRDDLEVRKVKTAIANGELHRFNDFLQRSFIELTTRIATGFFGQPSGAASRRSRSSGSATSARISSAASPQRGHNRASRLTRGTPPPTFPGA